MQGWQNLMLIRSTHEMDTWKINTITHVKKAGATFTSLSLPSRGCYRSFGRGRSHHKVAKALSTWSSLLSTQSRSRRAPRCTLVIWLIWLIWWLITFMCSFVFGFVDDGSHEQAFLLMIWWSWCYVTKHAAVVDIYQMVASLVPSSTLFVYYIFLLWINKANSKLAFMMWRNNLKWQKCKF